MLIGLVAKPPHAGGTERGWNGHAMGEETCQHRLGDRTRRSRSGLAPLVVIHPVQRQLYLARVGDTAAKNPAAVNLTLLDDINAVHVRYPALPCGVSAG